MRLPVCSADFRRIALTTRNDGIVPLYGKVQVSLWRKAHLWLDGGDTSTLVLYIYNIAWRIAYCAGYTTADCGGLGRITLWRITRWTASLTVDHYGGSRTVVRNCSAYLRIASTCAADSIEITIISLQAPSVWPHQATMLGQWAAYRLALPPERHAAIRRLQPLEINLRTVLGNQFQDPTESYCAKLISLR